MGGSGIEGWLLLWALVARIISHLFASAARLHFIKAEKSPRVRTLWLGRRLGQELSSAFFIVLCKEPRTVPDR